MTKQQARIYNQKLYEAFRAREFRIDGPCENVADALRARGVNISRMLGIDPNEIIREAENEAVRKRMRDADFRHGNQTLRSFFYDGKGWVFLPGRLWMMTRNPDEPDARNRREIILAELEAFLATVKVSARKFAAIVKGVKAVKETIKAGKVYEQPSLLGEESTPAA